MKTSRSIGLGLVALAMGIAFSTGRGTAPATSVATIDLAAVLDGLSQRASAEKAVMDMQMNMRDEDERRQEELRTLQTSLADLSGSDRRAAEDELAMKLLQYQAWRSVSDQQLDVEASLQMRGLYRTIRTAVANLAEAEGYDLVLVDDSSSEFALNPEAQVSRQLQVRQQIVGRRVIFGRDAIDVTEELIVRMNNAWEAGR